MCLMASYASSLRFCSSFDSTCRYEQDAIYSRAGVGAEPQLVEKREFSCRRNTSTFKAFCSSSGEVTKTCKCPGDSTYCMSDLEPACNTNHALIYDCRDVQGRN